MAKLRTPFDGDGRLCSSCRNHAALSRSRANGIWIHSQRSRRTAGCHRRLSGVLRPCRSLASNPDRDGELASRVVAAIAIYMVLLLWGWVIRDFTARTVLPPLIIFAVSSSGSGRPSRNRKATRLKVLRADLPSWSGFIN